MVKSGGVEEAVLVHRRLQGTPEEVFEAFTEPSILAQWFAPDAGWTTGVSVLEAKAGGAWSVTMTEPGGLRHVIRGRYLEVLRPRLLVFTWTHEPSPEENHVRIELTPSEGGCDLALSHARFASADSRARTVTGWGACLARLVALLEAPR